MSQSEDTYAPEEPTSDIPISMLDIQMPETPESAKGQVSDGDTPRLESPKLLKPVLGKVQAKKRLMAFANKFNVLPKVQNKSNLFQVHSAKISKSKNKSDDNKSLENNLSTGLSVDADSMQQFHNRHSSGSKSKKKTEEKILAIEEIRREESKSKMLLAEAMAAASLEEENYGNRNGQNLLENIKSIRERNRQDDINSSHKSGSKSSIESKRSDRRRYEKEERRDSTSRESKECGTGKKRYYKLSHNKEQRKKDKDKRSDKDKRDDSIKHEENRDKKDEEKDKKDNERDKWEEVKEKKGSKERRENFREKRSDSREDTVEAKDRKEKEKEKDRGKERDIMNSSSWIKLKQCGITMHDILDIRRRDSVDRPSKNRTAEDYFRHFEQMLMLNDIRLKRYAFIAEGLDGPKEYPPESIRITKRGRPQIIYSENSRMSLFLNCQQILQAVTTERREKMQKICEADFIRDNAEEEEKSQQTRDWYPKTGMCKSNEKTKWHVPISVQLPRSKWDSEDEDRLSNDIGKQREDEVKSDDIEPEAEQEAFSPRSSIMKVDISADRKTINEDNKSSSVIEVDSRQSSSPLLSSAGNEKLASEYEQFMKMVCNDIPVSKDFSPKSVPSKSSTLTLSYHEFNIETNLPEDNSLSFVDHSVSGRSDKIDTNKGEEKLNSNESQQNFDKASKEDEISSNSSHSQERMKPESKEKSEKSESEDSKSIPSDWENVRIKVERLSDENSDSRETRKKRKRKKMTSSSESSSTSSSSDSEEEIKRKKRKQKSSKDSDSDSDSDSSDSSSSSSSSDSSSSDDKRKKRRKKKRKAEKRKKKAKKIAKAKKKRKRKVSTDFSSSDSSDDRKKKKAASKKSKKKKEHSNKLEENEDIVKAIQKSPLQSFTPENTKLMRSQLPRKKIKEETKVESRKTSTEKHDIWSQEQELVRKVISDSDVCNKAHKDEEKRNKNNEEYLEEWDMDSVIMSQQKGQKLSKSNMEKMENTEIENIRKIERKDERSKRDEKSKKEERFKEKCSSLGKEVIQENMKIDEDNDAKKKKKKDKEKKSGNEFLTDWEKESERMSQQMMQEEMKLSKKLDKLKKDKWGETEFDTLNVPSLTQLEREVSKRQLLADDWEVDSLEAVPDLMINKKKSTRTSRKLEKEVRYDKKTDTYIAIEKETLRECKKRQDRLSAMRIWEEEEEEGEREAMMLIEQKNKRKKDEWDIEEESFLLEKSDKKESIENDISTTDIIHKEISTASKDADAPMKHDSVSGKKGKKSRWDMASQSEEKIELKAPVMWEEECAEWTKMNNFERKIDRVPLDHCDSMIPKSKIKDENSCLADQQSRKSLSKNSVSSDIVDLFSRKSQNVDLSDSSWTTEEQIRNKSRIRNLDNNSQRDAFFDETKGQTPSLMNEQSTAEQLKDIFEMDIKLMKKNIDLYSPSSPAASQKSEDIEAFDNSHSNSLNLREDFSYTPKKEVLIKSNVESMSIPNIPLQIKYRDNKYSKSTVTKDDFEEILGVQTEKEITPQKFDAKISDRSLDLSMNEPCPDSSIYKSLRMDIFSEFESNVSRNRLSNKSSEVVSADTKGDESVEGKAALKLIPKQLLVRRSNERLKSKLISDDPMQHATALLTIQKKLREAHAVKNVSCGEVSNEFKIECEQMIDNDASAIDIAPVQQTIVTEVDSKDLSITVKTMIATKSESPGSVKLFEEYKSDDKEEAKIDELKKPKISSSKDISDTERQRSPYKEQKRRSPSRKENRDDKRITDRGKEKRDKKYDDREKIDRKDGRGSRQEYNERRRSSPSGSRKRRRSMSPHTSWEQERSRSESQSRSWSRSRSKSPKRKDESFGSSSREKRPGRIDDERGGRLKPDDRREKSTRSPSHFSAALYNKDHFKKHGSTKGDRDDWSRRKYDSVEREKEGRSYELLDVLRERNVESDRHREVRSFWPYESENMLRDGNESIDSYSNGGQDLDLDYEEKMYYREDSIERDIMEGPLRPSSKFKYGRKNRHTVRSDRQWEKDRESLDFDRHGHVRRTEKSSRGRSSPRSRRSSHDRFRRGSRSRSRSWSKSRSRSRSRSRSTSRTRSRSRSTSRSRSMLRSRSRSRSGSRSRTRSTSRTGMRSPDYLRMTERLRSSRSPSVGRGRISEASRERKDEHDSMKLDNCSERGRRIETIVQTGLPRDSNVLDSEMHIGDNMESVASGFQYSNETEVGNEYYYTENNLTYPPCIDDSTTSSPKRLSLDDRLELELGIKKQQDNAGMSNDYGENFNSNVCYPSPTQQQQQQQQMMYRQQPTVLQVGNVLQVVPADFNGVPATRRESATTPTPPIVRGSSQVVRVGNVLQVVPTSLDWSGGQSSTVDQSGGMMYSASVPQPSPVPSVPISVPVPVPVPMPVPAVQPPMASSTPVSTLSPVPLPISVPVPVPGPGPVPLPVTQTTFPRTEVISQKVPAQPVYNYEAILETRRKEREERKRLREIKRKEKERRRIERINRRALRLLEKNNMRQAENTSQQKTSNLDPSVLKALRESEEQIDVEEQSSSTVTEKEEETPVAATAVVPAEEEVAGDEDEEEEEEEEAEVEDDEEDEEEAEEDEEEEDEDEEKSLLRVNSRRNEVDEIASTTIEISKVQVETESKEWVELPPTPLKGILVASGFRRTSIPNGNLDDFSTPENESDDNTDKEGTETDKNTESNKNEVSESKSNKLKAQTKIKSKSTKLSKWKQRIKKSVQFADGIKPGEGTSPSGGEGDMPSPPPPTSTVTRGGIRDIRRQSSRKSRKQEKRARPPKAKKKVKVKIIKLKKPRVTPLTAMMMDDSDELDDRSPPPPPPGSPPPPHLWPSYLSAYNSTIRTSEAQSTTPPTSSSTVQAPPPPTPLPLLVPPPPLNYTIQPCSKA